MKRLKRAVIVAAFLILGICIYTFCLGNEVFEGKFSNEPFSWYFLAKGIFCSITLYLLVQVLEVLQQKKGTPE